MVSDHAITSAIKSFVTITIYSYLTGNKPNGKQSNELVSIHIKDTAAAHPHPLNADSLFSPYYKGCAEFPGAACKKVIFYDAFLFHFGIFSDGNCTWSERNFRTLNTVLLSDEYRMFQSSTSNNSNLSALHMVKKMPKR